MADTRLTGVQNNENFLKPNQNENKSSHPLLSVSFRKHEERQDLHLPKISISGSKVKTMNRSRENTKRSHNATKHFKNLRQIEKFDRSVTLIFLNIIKQQKDLK